MDKFKRLIPFFINYYLPVQLFWLSLLSSLFLCVQLSMKLQKYGAKEYMNLITKQMYDLSMYLLGPLHGVIQEHILSQEKQVKITQIQIPLNISECYNR